MYWHEKIVDAVREKWGLVANLDEFIGVKELRDDWIVWLKEDAEKAGGLRLVVPKRGRHAFEIPSSSIADDQHGVSSYYEVHLRQSGQASNEAAIVLEKHAGISRREAYQGIKNGFSPKRSYFIEMPLTLIKELRALNVFVELVRPGGCGGYTMSGEVSEP